MLALLIVAALFTPVEAKPFEQSTPRLSLADVWLDCSWHETWDSTTSLGSVSRTGTNEHDFTRSYMFSPHNNMLFIYQADHTLLHKDATIGATAILVDSTENYESLGYESKSLRQWTVSRQDLKIKVFGSSLTQTRMDDGRIATNSILMNGDGSCVLADPKVLSIPAPNKF